jgi:endoglucanase
MTGQKELLMRNLWTELMIVMVAMATLLTSRLAAADGPTGGQTFDALRQNERLGRGVNVLGYDPIWKDCQKARFQEKYFRLIKEAGFNHIRINLHPFRDNKLSEDSRLSAAWFDVLDWAVKQALANRLLVILDLHEFQAMGADPAGNRERFLAVWRQIVEHAKDLPNEVLFEILNEPNKKLTPEVWNPLFRETLGIIRQSNPNRTVIVGPTSWNNINDLDKLDLPKEDRNLIVTVHYYSPFPFTHQGASWAGLTGKVGVPWNGAEKEQQAILKDFEKAQTWARQHNRPILLGEFGAYDKGEMESRVRWTSFVARQAERLGWSWAYWQFDGDFIVYDVKKDAWVEPIRRALTPPPDALPAPATAAGGPSRMAPQVIILKLDDVVAHSAQSPVSPRWQRTADFIEKSNLKASFGIIGYSLEQDNQAYFDWIKNLQRKGIIEFWNHGYRARKAQDKTGEFEESLEVQAAALQRTETLAREKLGIELKVFGPHWSGTNRDTEKALATVPEIKAWFYGPKGSKKFVFEDVLRLENPIFVPDPEKFKQLYQSRAHDKPCLALQGHPDQWDDRRWRGFVEIIAYLKSKGCVFMTPSAYMERLAEALPRPD